MKINQDNYEQYFLDHAEGNLSPEMERELALFLEANPELKPVLENYDPSPLPKSDINSNHLKNRLKKNIRPTLHIGEANVDEWLNAKGEGQLSASEIAELQEFLKLNPAYAYDLKLMELSRLEPDLSVTFSGKNKLKKRAAILSLTRLAWAIPAAAAVILIFIGIKFFNKPENVNNQGIKQQYVQQESKVQEPVVPKPVNQVVTKDEGTPAQKDFSPKGLHPPEADSIRQRRTPSLFNMESKETIALALNNLPENARLYLTSHRLPEMEPMKKKEGSFLAKALGNMVLGTQKALKKNTGVEKIRNADVNFWSIAEAGVKGFNTATDRDVELRVRKDDDGRIKSYALVEDDHLIYSKKKAKN